MGTATGPANLEADWTANTINLEWYNEDTKLTVPTTSNTCRYDGGITLPSTNPTKTGYTFKGWKVRRANVPAPTYTACSQIQDETTCGQYSENGCSWYNSNCVLYYQNSAPSQSWCEDTYNGIQLGSWCSANDGFVEGCSERTGNTYAPCAPDLGDIDIVF